MSNLVELKNIYKKYPNEEYNVLNNFNLKIEKGSFNSLIGQSGSGKSTILNIISGFDKANKGEALFKNKNISSFSEKELNKFRNKEIGIIYQFHNLLSDFSVIENVILPALLDTTRKEAIKKQKKY